MLFERGPGGWRRSAAYGLDYAVNTICRRSMGEDGLLARYREATASARRARVGGTWTVPTSESEKPSVYAVSVASAASDGRLISVLHSARFRPP